ncbi:transcriptional regulator [Sulfobacillus thermosulfidooxidans]|uniref:LysR family transcriptional regulator n=3 Tax=Sulfobacillus thermosulfidooxidans TaxID=28034 RepID=A0A1R0IHP7_SULTH|nr:LysR family transcriptional regulator [Sulfobacillus thermosulfidooxidans]OLZ13224.1 transcriptional regulator [Sulfobacillus thermosulfidooxidans]OLZ21604.1 transcriptional regulator [Sulfobacillus thermosulfidooxidans]PSR24432.1 MAG: LysR family transcriptional regulator [Sulfobacillus thermosulfidooxidans]
MSEETHYGTLNLHHLKVFQTVVRHLSFSRAAEELLISQSAVSMHVKSLERAVGLPLFEKVGHHIRLTAAGESLWSYSQKIFALMEETQQVMSALKGGNIGQLRVAADTTVGVYVVPEYLGQFRRMFPQVAIMLDVANRATVMERIAAREADLAVMGQVPEDVAEWDATPFMENDLVVIASPDHPLAQKRFIATEELAHEGFLVREVGSGTRATMERYFNQAGITFRVNMELGNNSTIKQGVAHGLGIAVISRRVIQLELESKRLVILPVEGFPLKRYWYVVHLRGHYLPPPAKALKDLLLQQARV